MFIFAKRSIFFKMAQYNELPVYKATYDLLLAIFQFTKEFNKEYKYTVGESLKKETIELSITNTLVSLRKPNTPPKAYQKVCNQPNFALSCN